MKKLILCGTAFIVLFGCATAPDTRQDGLISSNPPGANVQIVEEKTGNMYFIGKTPVDFWVRQVEPMYLYLELEGYLPEKVPISKEGNFSRHVDLKKDPAPQIRDELSTYSQEFIKASLDVAAKCERTLNPEGAVADESRTELEKVQRQFPQYRESALFRELNRAVDYTQRHRTVAQPRRYETNPGTQFGYGVKAAKVIREIRQQLGMEPDIKPWTPPKMPK